MRKPLVLALAVVVLSGCTTTIDVPGVPSVTSTVGPNESSDGATCVDWVGYSTLDDVAADAQLVVVGTVAPATSTVNLFGDDVPVHTVTIETYLAGSYPGATIEVAAVPDTCSGTEPFAAGDPLDTTERVELFLVRTSGIWRPLTPRSGIEVVPDGGPLPWEPASTP
jgi:hypothetical protein